jgi:phosphate-selective porin OprO/OprP
MAEIAAQLSDMRAELDAMKARLDAQQQAVDQARAEADAATARALAAENRLAEIETRTAETSATPPAIAVEWKGAPEISGEDGWSVKPRGRIQYDVGHVGRPAGIDDEGLGFSNEFRRVRIGLQGSMPGGFGYRIEVDFADDDIDLNDAYLSYETGAFGIGAGQRNNFQSLEELTSSLDISFLERAAFTDAFGFERRLGLWTEYQAGDVLAQGGVFTDNAGDLGDDRNENIGVSGRLVFMPSFGGTQLHLGASAHWRDLGFTDPALRFRQRPFVHTTNTRFIDTGAFLVDSEHRYGVEAAMIAGRLHAAAEAHWQNVHRPTSPHPTFFGGYGEIGYFLTDHRRGYRGGEFKAPKVANGFDAGGAGAVQIVARYDYLDLNDSGFSGGTQDGYALGISWWPAQYVRLMLNYARLEYEDAAIPTFTLNPSYGVDVVGGRFQISF